MNTQRTERDSMGDIQVPAERLWGAQTQRSLEHFAISHEAMPTALLHAMAQVKCAAAVVNAALGLLLPAKAHAIAQAAQEVANGLHAQEFPLVVWQTGSGTQSHMNMNEVLANRASELLGGVRGRERLVHANDDVNMGQSSNDVFPTAMSIAAVKAITQNLLPNLAQLTATLELRSKEFSDIVKIGRTHLQDATPLTLGQEISGWVAQLRQCERHIGHALPHLGELAIGGTAVGTGLNTHAQFATRMADELARSTGLPLTSASNKFEALAAHDAIVQAHACLKTLAVALAKIANDVRWLASGPRCGLGELQLPENEPGSSIMPGKVNPTQCEALLMVCYQVFGNDVAITWGGTNGNLQLNVCKPLLAHNFLQSARMLSDAMHSFDTHCAQGLLPNRARIDELLNRSLMLVTALNSHIGYDNAAAIAKAAHAQGITLREAALQSGLVGEDQFDDWVRPRDMT